MKVDLEELERLAAQATPLPWRHDPDENFLDHDCQIIKGDTAFVCEFVTEANAVYITAACNALPELIKMYREADDEAADANSAWQKVRRENLALREQVRELEAKNKDLGIRSMLNNGRAFRLADYIANSGMCAFCPAYDEFCMADGACRLVDCIEAIYKWADKQAAKEAGK